MRKIAFSLLMSLSLGFIACEEEIIIPPDLPATISFKNDLVPVFQSKCVGCHGATSSSGLYLTADLAYQSLTDNNLIKENDPTVIGLYTKLASGHGAVSSVQLPIFLKWIEQGSANN